MRLPLEILTDRLVLRAWREEDAVALCPILEANFDHLGPWIPARVSTPAPAPELEKRLAGFAADFAADREWRYALHAREDGRLLGEAGLFPRSPAGRVPFSEADRVELGYWIRRDAAGEGFVAEASRALVALVTSIREFSLVEVRCDARNLPSAAIPRRLGFGLVNTIESPSVTDGEPPVQFQVWSLDLAAMRDA
ncbi:MAG TPA: GNAT family N-acetyltransferase [Gemmatimonadaceae bacterium]